jgi:hypothetical protein
VYNINYKIKYYLIKSGGGYGPLKPSNLLYSKVLNPTVGLPKDEDTYMPAFWYLKAGFKILMVIKLDDYRVSS